MFTEYAGDFFPYAASESETPRNLRNLIGIFDYNTKKGGFLRPKNYTLNLQKTRTDFSVRAFYREDVFTEAKWEA